MPLLGHSLAHLSSIPFAFGLPEYISETDVEVFVKEKASASFIERLRKFLMHPLVAILLGWGIALDGPGNIRARSCFFTLCCLWAVYEIWQSLSRSRIAKEWRNSLFAFLCCLIFTAEMGTMYWLLANRLEEIEQQTFQSLTPKAVPASGNILESVFTFTNESGGDIGDRIVTCSDIYVTWSDGRFIHDPGGASTGKHYNYPLKAQGDAYSSQCLFHALAWSNFSATGISCVDVTVTLDYALIDQPDIKKSKSHRFVAMQGGGADFRWADATVGNPVSYCPQMPKLPTQPS